MFNLLMDIRRTRKAFKKAKATKEGFAFLRSLELAKATTQAAAYGFEIGKGQPLLPEVKTSMDNPFLNENWRDRVINND